MAYLLAIHRRKCATCPGEAKYVLRNRFNEDINWYCAKHCDAALKRLQEAETDRR